MCDPAGRTIPALRNYPLQYVLVASAFILGGIATLLLGGYVGGLGLIAFGLAGEGMPSLRFTLGSGADDAQAPHRGASRTNPKAGDPVPDSGRHPTEPRAADHHRMTIVGDDRGHSGGNYTKVVQLWSSRVGGETG